MLVEDITEEEIKEVTWIGKEGKACDLNGFALSFFKASWDVVGLDVTMATKHFFTTRQLLKEVNSTFISLIPKKLKATTFILSLISFLNRVIFE